MISDYRVICIIGVGLSSHNLLCLIDPQTFAPTLHVGPGTEIFCYIYTAPNTWAPPILIHFNCNLFNILLTPDAEGKVIQSSHPIINPL